MAKALAASGEEETALATSSSRRTRGLLEDAMPIQRTSALLVVAIPTEVSPAELQVFLSEAGADVEALRILLRRPGAQSFSPPPRCAQANTNKTPVTAKSTEESSLQEPAAGASGLSGDFYSAVVLCRTQTGADALYRSSHGRIFQAWSLAETPARVAGAGPCCYLVFLEAVVYTIDADIASAPQELLADVVPSAAYELPACPYCLERLDVSGTGMITHNHGWLSATSSHPACKTCCQACSAMSRGKLSCEMCDRRQEIWVCLICGHLGCGRYAAGHSLDHSYERQHRFCLEIASGRIWDYSGDVFVHRRLIQMTAASGGFELSLPAPAAGDDPASPALQSSGMKPTWPGHEDYLAMELDAILASQLDYQRSLYEARLTEGAESHAEAVEHQRSLVLQAEARQAKVQTEIAEAEKRRKTLERQLAAARKSRGDAQEQVAFLKELNQSLLANRRDMAAASERADAEKGAAAANRPQPEEGEDALVKRLRDRVAKLMASISEHDAGASSSQT